MYACGALFLRNLEMNCTQYFSISVCDYNNQLKIKYEIDNGYVRT